MGFYNNLFISLYGQAEDNGHSQSTGGWWDWGYKTFRNYHYCSPQTEVHQPSLQKGDIFACFLYYHVLLFSNASLHAVMVWWPCIKMSNVTYFSCLKYCCIMLYVSYILNIVYLMLLCFLCLKHCCLIFHVSSVWNTTVRCYIFHVSQMQLCIVICYLYLNTFVQCYMFVLFHALHEMLCFMLTDTLVKFCKFHIS